MRPAISTVQITTLNIRSPAMFLSHLRPRVFSIPWRLIGREGFPPLEFLLHAAGSLYTVTEYGGDDYGIMFEVIQ
jgi:hypothetical protein